MKNFGIYTLGIERKHLDLPFGLGWGNGYVLLPKDHPWYGIDYDDIDVNIHGGLTFGTKFESDYFLDWIKDNELFGDVNRDNYERFDKYWILGFDTAHLGDNLLTCSKLFVIREVDKLKEQCLDDNIESIRIYKQKYLRKDKLKIIEASVLALSSKQ